MILKIMKAGGSHFGIENADIKLFEVFIVRVSQTPITLG